MEEGFPAQAANTLRLSAHDGSAFIQLERRDIDGYAIFDIAAEIAEFKGRNHSVVLSKVADFLRQLDEFEISRRGTATLEGSEQFHLSIEALDTAGHIWVSYRLCRYVHTFSNRGTIPLTLEAGFGFEAEFTIRLVKEFHGLLRNYQ